MGAIHHNKQVNWLKFLQRQLRRPNQGPAEGPYWIVLNLSAHKDLRLRPPSFHFRHPTIESARTEAARLAAEPNLIGRRFGIFTFTGETAKVELPAAYAKVEETAVA